MRTPRSPVPILALMLAFAAAGGNAVAATGSPPNIVVIMADDLSVNAFEDLLDGGWLPNLQAQLVERGVRFDRSYVTTPSCCPSRATFLTGQYAHNHRVYSNHSPVPPAPGIASPGWFADGATPGRNESTVATWLRDAGYVTGFVGKYLNGYGEHAPDGVADPRSYVPPGWHDWQGLIDITTYRVFDYEINDNGTIIAYGDDEPEYQTDVLAARAADFIREQSRTPRPFFLWVNTLAPHVEVLDAEALLEGNDPRGGFELAIRPAPRHAHLADGDPENGEMPPLRQNPSFDEADVSDKPSCPFPPPPEGITFNVDPYCVGDRLPIRDDPDLPFLERQHAKMLASMLAVDDLVGAVTAALEVNDAGDETVLVFTSDNGWLYGEHRMIGKAVAYEESIRVPLIIRAPGAPANVRSSSIVLNTDLAPTLAEIAGTTPPYDVDGTSLVPLLDGTSHRAWRRTMFLVEHWFVPSFVKFEDATYYALRSPTAGRDLLYVATQADAESPGLTTHRELYDHRGDPFQTEAVALPPSVFDLLLQLFTLSAGEQCRQLESL